jgi:ribonuclease T1
VPVFRFLTVLGIGLDFREPADMEGAMKVLKRVCLFLALVIGTGAIPQFGGGCHLEGEVCAYSQGSARFDENNPTVDFSQLPQEAKDMLNLIKRGGPFLHRKDGSVFGNRERRLPARSRGYYREYTVKTPESRDRGARRIVAGAGGEYYYTDDHYSTFKLIRGVLP